MPTRAVGTGAGRQEDHTRTSEGRTPVNRIRALTMVVALAGWIATLAATIAHGEIPSPILLSCIAGILGAVYPEIIPWSRRSQAPEPPSTEGNPK